MADVFLSYAREDRVRAEQIAHGLESAGVDVFWDNEIPPGQTWADYIEQKLTQCKALIVLWSEHSTKSQWVREEARMGRDKGVLIPVMIDASTPPFGFGEVQAANLSNWNGEADHPHWRRFVDAVATFAKAAPRPQQQAMGAAPRAPAPPPPRMQPAASAPAGETKKGLPVWVWVVGGVVATIVVLGVIGSMMPQDGAQVAGNQPVQPAAGQPQQSGGAPAVDYQSQINGRLGQVQQALAPQGFQPIGQPFQAQLNQGAYQNLPQITLQVGIDYRIVAVCDNDCANIDLNIYDQNNVLVAQDVMTDAMPVGAVSPQWTGPFVVQAVMTQCTVQPCYYAVALYGRPLQ